MRLVSAFAAAGGAAARRRGTRPSLASLRRTAFHGSRMRLGNPRSASPHELQDHIAGSYLSLRVGIGAIAVLFPLVLAGGGSLWAGEPLLASFSDYYHTGMRNIFVGVIFAIGAFLFLYKGFSGLENHVLDAAGFLALCVAMLPARLPGAPHTLASRLHTAAAILFFLCIAYVAVFRASDTLPLVGDAAAAAWYDGLYRLYGAGMILSPVSAWVADTLFGSGRYIFFLELLGVWAFAAFWITKGIEIHRTNADLRAARCELERDDRGNVVPSGTVESAHRPPLPSA